jgi:hypothetical protein
LVVEKVQNAAVVWGKYLVVKMEIKSVQPRVTTLVEMLEEKSVDQKVIQMDNVMVNLKAVQWEILMVG